MHEDHPHPLLAQLPLTVSPFVSLPTATPLPYTYKQLPSTLPPSVTDPPAPAGGNPDDQDNNNSSSSPPKPTYVTSASGQHAAHPDDIIASCRALQAHLTRLTEDARATARRWEDGLRERDLAEKRRVAPGWLDEEVKMLVPERKGGGGGGEQQPGGASLMDEDAPPPVMHYQQQQQQQGVGGEAMQGVVQSDEGAELDRAFGGLGLSYKASPTENRTPGKSRNHEQIRSPSSSNPQKLQPSPNQNNTPPANPTTPHHQLPSSTATSNPSTPDPEAAHNNNNNNLSSPSSSDIDDADLPYPTELPRSAFTVPAPHFSAAAYLSTLSHRHQTLGDLRADLRARSALISRELLDLVNANYADFLSLGRALRGGDDRVEEVRVGLLGMRKAVGEVREAVAGREEEVRGLVGEREGLVRGRAVARALLEVERRVGELEAALVVGQQGQGQGTGEGGEGSSDGEEEEDDDGDDDDEETDGEDEAEGNVSLGRLRRLARQYLGVRQTAGRIGKEHPFLVAQEPRLTKIRNTLLLDLGAELKSAKSAGPQGKNRVLKVMSIYAEMDEGIEAIKVLRGRS
ncbi:conserved oligomeric golgi complex subunit 2 protein [Diplodia corticola]|uniref:Conserved oligomeric Golgi complex subunit 2 n=1 Tax=Diplodia corticola TaxID=236234 RepID=A0A1J9QYM9_9PEZI|nr:conserved oligomeric golgi complex subunit 2 protein [Diplodia corticola]OJD33489.1 conserved oligomeric golgi complex subunit 2 protein [Diplodia corticola]